MFFLVLLCVHLFLLGFPGLTGFSMVLFGFPWFSIVFFGFFWFYSVFMDFSPVLVGTSRNAAKHSHRTHPARSTRASPYACMA